MIDQQIDLVARQRQAAADDNATDLAFGLGLLAQLFGALDHVLQHLVEEFADIGQIGVAFLQFLDQVADGETHGVATNVLEPRLQFAAPARKLVHQLLQLFAVFLHRLAVARLILVRQGFELLRAHGLLALDRGKDETLRRTQQRNADFRRGLAQRAQRPLLLLLEFFLDGFDARAVFVALECRRNGLGQFGDELLHVRLEPAAAAGRQLQQSRPDDLGEVIHVAQIAGNRFGGGTRFEQAPHGGMPAAAGLAQHEQVEARPLDGDAEFYGVDGARLINDCDRLAHLGGGREAERLRIATAAKLFRLEWFHGAKPSTGSRWHLTSIKARQGAYFAPCVSRPARLRLAGVARQPLAHAADPARHEHRRRRRGGGEFARRGRAALCARPVRLARHQPADRPARAAPKPAASAPASWSARRRGR